MKKTKQLVSLLLVVVLSVGALVGCNDNSANVSSEVSTSLASSESTLPSESSASASSQTGTVAESSSVNNHSAEYLSYYFDIDSSTNWDAASFTTALATITGVEGTEVDGELTLDSAVKAAITAAGFQELALTYPETKIQQGISKYSLSTMGEDVAYLVCALDLEMITPLQISAFSNDTAWDLLLSVADAVGVGRNELAYSTDPDIYAKIMNRWNSFTLFDNETLSTVGRTGVENGIITGYNQKDASYNARFLPDYTMQYGHSDIRHAQQLIGLLNSENIPVKVQLEPKVSVYEYLLEWGDVPGSTPTYEVKKFSDDLYLTYAVEYDLMLEFNSLEDMQKFNQVIEDYAKKYEGNEDALGLLYDSWWQPLYSTTRTDMDAEQYHLINDIVISSDEMSIHTFTLPENTDTTLQTLESYSPDLASISYARYCNTAFYNYLSGSDYQ